MYIRLSIFFRSIIHLVPVLNSLSGDFNSTLIKAEAFGSFVSLDYKIFYLLACERCRETVDVKKNDVSANWDNSMNYPEWAQASNLIS